MPDVGELSTAYRSRTRALRWLLGTLLVGQLVVMVRMRRLLSHDVAMYLQAASLVLDGKRLFVDVIDPNPPMVTYLSLPAAVMHRFTGLSIAGWMAVVVWVAIVASVTSVVLVLGRAGVGGRLGPTVVGLSYASVQWIVVARWEWGQREHLFLLALVPLLLLVAASDRLVGPRTAAVVGAFAGLTACLKPWFAVIAVLPAVWVAIRTRTPRLLLRTEWVAFWSVVVLYALHFFVVGSLRREFVGHWLPIIASGYDDAFRGSLGGLSGLRESVVHPDVRVLPWTVAAGVLAAATVVTALGALRRRTGLLEEVLLIAGWLSLIAFVQQQKGWWYQSIPLFGCASVAAALVVTSGTGESADDERRAVTRWWMALRRLRAPVSMVGVACLAAWWLVASLPSVRSAVDPPAPAAAFEAMLRALSDTGDPVLVVDTSVTPAYPALLNIDRVPGSRYLWMFPVVIGASQQDPTVDQRFVDELVADVDRLEPSLVIVREGRCPFCPEGVRLPEYLDEHGLRLTERGYERVEALAGWRAFVRVVSPG